MCVGGRVCVQLCAFGKANVANMEAGIEAALTHRDSMSVSRFACTSCFPHCLAKLTVPKTQKLIKIMYVYKYTRMYVFIVDSVRTHTIVIQQFY